MIGEIRKGSRGYLRTARRRTAMADKLLIVHGGGPTAVLNASLYGALTQAKISPRIGEVYGALGGTKGLVEERFQRLDTLGENQLSLLPRTPGTAIGTSRYPLTQADYPRMRDICLKNGFRYVLFSGGNGTMESCLQFYLVSRDMGIVVAGIPKTVDNDITGTDHAPGYGSAARFAASACAAMNQDVKSLPIHVSILELMGRNAGWITASTALARRKEGDAPHMILLPERPFDQEVFLKEVEALYKKYGGVVVAASEGLKDLKGQHIVPPIFTSGRATYYGDVGTHLAGLIIQHMGIKSRSEKPGMLGRCAMEYQSHTAREEAVQAGAEAGRCVVEEQGGVMVAFERISSDPYRLRLIRIPLEQAALKERTMPDEFIAPNNMDVTPEFLTWAKPLIGGPLPEYFQW